jgi:HK97 family phage major capsid protein
MPTVLDRLHDERTSLLDQVDSITGAAESDDRDLSTAEQELIDRCHNRIADEIDPQLERLERIERTRSEHNRIVLPHVAPNGATVPVPVGTPEVVYRTFAEYARDVLITRYDAIAQRAGPNSRTLAAERIERVVANTLTSDIPGLIRPQYLSEFAQVIDASRPIVSTARRVPLESGTLTYPSITQRPSVAKQTTEKTETSSQKMTVVFVNVTADTYAGSGDLSWQAINWSTPNALELWFTLAAEAYAIQTEAATGTVVAASTTMATPAIPATPTLADWMTAITAAAGVIYTASRRRPDTVYADVTTGYSIMGLVSNVAPVFITTGNFSIASGQGSIAGLRLVISAGLPAKTVVVGDSQSLLAAETAGSPVELRAVEPALGGMEVGVIGAYVAKITDAGAFRKLTIP